jgi:transposase InsO family protein
LRSSLSAVEEEAAVELRRMLDLSVDDIVAAMRAGINAGLSRSAIYRALRRRGVSSRKKVAPAIVHGRFAAESEPGFIHLDLKYLTRLGGKPSYVFVAIDRATRYVYCEIHGNRETATAAAFCERMAAHFAPCRVRVVLSDNGFEWTDRAAGRVKAKPTGKHPVDRFCAAQGIEHRLTRLRRPQTNGMVERFNRRISEALAAKQRIRDNAGRNCFATHAERNDYIRRFVHNYNRTRLLCLQQRSPLQMMQHYLAKQYTFAGMTVIFFLPSTMTSFLPTTTAKNRRR